MPQRQRGAEKRVLGGSMDSTARARLLKEYPEALDDDRGTIFVGAGVSMAAGYPSWVELLKDIGDELGVSSSDIHDLAALAQWSIQESGSATRVRNVIREHIGKILPVPASLKTIARFPIRHIWTTNYDRLIERAFEEISRPVDPISAPSDLSLKTTPGAVHLYKMHGSVDRLDDVVISTDDYELYRRRRGAFLPLLQAHLTSTSMLFVGISFTDPNIKHVLSLIRDRFVDAPPEHFAIVRPPQRDQSKTSAEYEGKFRQHSLWAKDLRRYGLVAVEIENYDEVPGLLREIERRVARRRVWISGSWPVEGDSRKIYELSQGVGREIGAMGLTLVSGAGLVVGSASLAGFLASLRNGGGWDLERRLIARPFPQPLLGSEPDRSQWVALREEMARLSGFVVVLGGAKFEGGSLTPASGVLEEVELAQRNGAFILPVGASGGAAKFVAKRLLGSDMLSAGPEAVRPTDGELQALLNRESGTEELIALVGSIIKRIREIQR